MYRTIAILLTILLFFGILSCNLDGSGIFLTISESTEIADSNLATEPVRDILYKDADTMYILHGTSLKKSDISVSDPTWITVDFSKPISEAVFYNGVSDKLYFASINTNDSKTVYVGDIATPAVPTAIIGLEDVQVIDMLIDGTDVYVITYDQTSATPVIKIYTISTTTDTAVLSGSFTTDVAPTSVHFIDNSGTKYFIFVFYDETEGFLNKYVSFPNFNVVTELTDPVFQVSDDASKNSPIIGTYAYGGNIYLVNNEGILITSSTIDNLGSAFTAVNATDSSEFMSIVLNPSGSTASIYSIPMTVVKKLDATELLIMGGLSDIYYYDIATPAEIPIEFTSNDAFYSNVSSTQILDFYNVPGVDFSLYTATSDKWIWETIDEDTTSIQLL